MVGLAERFILGAGPDSVYQHAFIYIGGNIIIQAEPTGAAYAQLTDHAHTLWSSYDLTSVQRDAICDTARGYVGTPYSALDYVAIALHHWHLPAPGLKAYIASTRHQICSQLVDQCYLEAGVHLFDDGRWPGYVTPADLAHLLTRAAAGELT